MAKARSKHLAAGGGKRGAETVPSTWGVKCLTVFLMEDRPRLVCHATSIYRNIKEEGKKLKMKTMRDTCLSLRGALDSTKR